MKKDRNQPEREGDVLGISDADPNVQIPKPADKGSGHVRGIEVGHPATGIGDVPQSSGATGIDMGSGGSGTARESARTRRSGDPEEQRRDDKE